MLRKNLFPEHRSLHTTVHYDLFHSGCYMRRPNTKSDFLQHIPLPGKIFLWTNPACRHNSVLPGRPSHHVHHFCHHAIPRNHPPKAAFRFPGTTNFPNLFLHLYHRSVPEHIPEISAVLRPQLSRSPHPTDAT